MKTLWKTSAAVAVAAMALWGTGCPPQCPNPNDPLDPACPPPVVPDNCNSLSEALSDPACVLAQDAGYLGYISVANDEDWLSFTTPSTVDARTLVRVTAGYGALVTTGVQLAVNLLREDGSSSLMRVVDQHASGPPKPVEIVTRFTEPNTRLVVLLTDQPANPTLPQSDPRNQYQVTWNLSQDPDVNEPNDTTPTQIQLTAGGGGLQGSGSGVLATPDDRDLFSLCTAPGCTSGIAAGKILYFHISELAPAPLPINYRLAYTLYGPPGFPSGNIIGEGRMDNEFLHVDLATARRTPAAGVYAIAIHAYREPGVLGPLPGDERLTYKIDVQVVDEQDLHEPNDTLGQSMGAPTALALNTPVSLFGRIGSVGDPDWYALDLAADTNPANPTVLHYKLRPPPAVPAVGRFPALPAGPGGVDRALHLVTDVTAAGTTNCKNDPAVCPKGYTANPAAQADVEGVCSRTTPQCLWSYRVEEQFQYPNLRNFEGRVQIPPHGSGSARYYVSVEDFGNDWADDRNYTLEVTLLRDGDEAARVGLPGQTTVVAGTLANVPAGTFPGGATTLSGQLSFGYGRLFENDPGFGQGIRGPKDYDAMESDLDRYELNLPGVNPLAGPTDTTFELQYTVYKADGGVPFGLFMDLEFCDGTKTATDGGSCAVVATSKGGAPLRLGYQSGNLGSWWNYGPGSVAFQKLWDFTSGAPGDTATARPYACLCFEPRFLAGPGKFYLSVGLMDRESWDMAPYQVLLAYTSYPLSFDGGTGVGTMTCPLATDAGVGAGFLDAGWNPGCNFTK